MKAAGHLSYKGFYEQFEKTIFTVCCKDAENNLIKISGPYNCKEELEKQLQEHFSHLKVITVLSEEDISFIIRHLNKTLQKSRPRYHTHTGHGSEVYFILYFPLQPPSSEHSLLVCSCDYAPPGNPNYRNIVDGLNVGQSIAHRQDRKVQSLAIQSI